MGTAVHTGPIERADLDVAAAARGDRVAFAAVYDRYGPRLHDYCLGILRDRDAAADCVQDTFCTAATRLHQLREPDKLRPWLYAIARHEAHRRLRARRREQTVDELPEQESRDQGPATLAGHNQLAVLIREAAGGLSERDRAVLDLHYRHGLDGPELAAALGVSHTAANTLVGRLRTTIERSLGALLVARAARTRPGRCADLDAVLAGWDGRLTVLMRKRIARHLEHCGDCDGVRKRMVTPQALLASVPFFVPAPLMLRHHVLAAASTHLPAVASTSTASAVATTSWWPAAKAGGLAQVLHGVPLAVAAPAVAAVAAVPVIVVGAHLHPSPAAPQEIVAPTAVVHVAASRTHTPSAHPTTSATSTTSTTTTTTTPTTTTGDPTSESSPTSSPGTGPTSSGGGG